MRESRTGTPTADKGSLSPSQKRLAELREKRRESQRTLNLDQNSGDKPGRRTNEMLREKGSTPQSSPSGAPGLATGTLSPARNLSPKSPLSPGPHSHCLTLTSTCLFCAHTVCFALILPHSHIASCVALTQRQLHLPAICSPLIDLCGSIGF